MRDRCTRPGKKHKWELEQKTEKVNVYRCAFCLGLRYVTRADPAWGQPGKWKSIPKPASVKEAIAMALKQGK